MAGGAGLAEDIRFYGGWIEAHAEKRIGKLYPLIEITGGRLTRGLT